MHNYRARLHVRYRRFADVPRALKQAARSAAREAVLRGELQRRPCEVVGCMVVAEMHHDDYSQPLVVRWLCRPHHFDVHDGWDVDQLGPV